MALLRMTVLEVLVLWVVAVVLAGMGLPALGRDVFRGNWLLLLLLWAGGGCAALAAVATGGLVWRLGSWVRRAVTEGRAADAQPSAADREGT